MDYFIHKNLGGFLRRELDFYIKNEVMRLDDIEAADAPRVESYLKKLQSLRKIARRIIDFLAQIEDFQKKLWLKKKLIIDTQYCIALSEIPEAFYPEIATNEVQRQEWVDVCRIDRLQNDLTQAPYSVPLTIEFLRRHSTLMVDTRHFSPEFLANLLSTCVDLDDKVDGVLINSDNFQALNLMQAKYQSQVKTIAIDPPYNRQSDDFPYKDNYKHSSWASMMADRLRLGWSLLSAEGALFSNIDENERDTLSAVLDTVFGRDNRIEELIWAQNTTHSQSPLYSTNHEYVEVYAKDRGAAERAPAMFRESAGLSVAELERFDANLVAHTQTINARRKIKGEMAWKYFQWLSLLFVEIYLDRYFNDRQGLCLALNDFVERFNLHHQKQKRETGITSYAVEDLNKICLQNATGSGKTLLMHVNLLQFAHHARATGQADAYSRVIVLSPNERLSEQHERELRENGFYPEALRQESDLVSRGQSALDVPLLTEITKLADEQKVKQMAVDSFGDANLLLVDEGHRGMSGSDWKSKRDKLAAKGFTFEYSATFKQAIKAANDRVLAESYAKAVLFDYSYRYFYADGYGKDYRIFNLPRDELAHKDTYLTAALLAFYQQLRMFTEAGKRYAGYNLEKPLWVFVGASVTGRKVDEDSVSPSDVAQILDFLARFLARKEEFIPIIGIVLSGNCQQTGLMDAQGRDIFVRSFPYLKDLKLEASAIYNDICQRLFHAPGGGHLVVERVKGDSGELLLKVGEADQAFGVINVGDAVALAKHVQEELEHKQSLAEVRPSEFGEPVFGDVHKPDSPIHLLVGSKKFIEGWDCWRVSSLGLMRMGQSEGAQIIQLFGRGVRLKGKDMSLMRTSRYQPVNPPRDIHFLETLNVFGVQADFMATFRDFLESEGLPPNDEPRVETIELNVTHDFGQKLKILRAKIRKDTQEQYDFRKHGPIVNFSMAALPPGMTQKGAVVTVDRFPRLQMIQASEVSNEAVEAANSDPCRFDTQRLNLLDWDALWFDLERFRRQRHLDNVTVRKETLRPMLSTPDWYHVLVPSQMWHLSMGNIRHWQSIAFELLSGALERCFIVLGDEIALRHEVALVVVAAEKTVEMVVDLSIVGQRAAAFLHLLASEFVVFADGCAFEFRLQVAIRFQSVLTQRLFYLEAGSLEQVVGAGLSLAGEYLVDFLLQFVLNEGFDLGAAGMQDAIEAKIEFGLIELEELFEQGDKFVFMLIHGELAQFCGTSGASQCIGGLTQAVEYGLGQVFWEIGGQLGGYLGNGLGGSGNQLVDECWCIW